MIGLLLVSLAFITPLLERLPLSVSTVYLAVGLLLGPGALSLLSWNLVSDAGLFERVSEVAVIVSLFTVGLTMRRAPRDRGWLVPVRLASVTMVLTIIAISAVGYWLIGLPLGAAVLLGAILAPTDPVLASDVQLQDPTDRDTLRSAISGEAGLNDGTAFPFVMLGLGLLGLHPGDEAGLFNVWSEGTFSFVAWLGWDVLWAVSAGLGLGYATGWLVGKTALWMQHRLSGAFSLHEFLVLGVVALTYGVTELVYGYGFLAVFMAGYALRHIELHSAGYAPEPAELPAVKIGNAAESMAANSEPEQAAHFLAASLLDFNDKLEHLLSAAVVILVGAAIWQADLPPEALWLAPLLFLVLRPLSVWIGLLGSRVAAIQQALIGWFGIRGIGSVYYLTYAISHGVEGQLAERLTGLVLSLVAISILVHGVTVTPLMGWYEKRKDAGQAEDEETSEPMNQTPRANQRPTERRPGA